MGKSHKMFEPNQTYFKFRLKCGSHEKITAGFILVLIPLVVVVSFADDETVKYLKWVDHKPNPRFAIYDPGTPTDEGDDLVFDKEKRLIWARNANLGRKKLIWREAINYCQELALGSLKGWRLPTKEEVSNLIDPSQGIPALPKGHPFVNLMDSYWTSTTHDNPVLSGNAYCFHLGYCAVRPFAKFLKFYAWPVTGQ